MSIHLYRNVVSMCLYYSTAMFLSFILQMELFKRFDLKWLLGLVPWLFLEVGMNLLVFVYVES